MRFRGDPSSLRGSIAPVVTAFTDDGQLDLQGHAAAILDLHPTTVHVSAWRQQRPGL